MVFVHARNATVQTAERLRDLAMSFVHLNQHDTSFMRSYSEGAADDFRSEDHPYFATAQKAMEKSRSKQLRDLFGFGFAVHHAGMCALLNRAFSTTI